MRKSRGASRGKKLFTTCNVPFHAATEMKGLKMGTPSAPAAARSGWGAQIRQEPTREARCAGEFTAVSPHQSPRHGGDIASPPALWCAVPAVSWLGACWRGKERSEKHTHAADRRLAMRFLGTPQIIKTPARF